MKRKGVRDCKGRIGRRLKEENGDRRSWSNLDLEM